MKEYVVREYDSEDYRNVEDSMTPNDIINYLRYIRRGYLPDYNCSGDEADFERYKLHTAINKAISIIDKYKSGNEV